MSLDRLGQWSQEKLAMLSEYLHAYAVIMNAQKRSWLSAFYYVDAFAGPGVARSKDAEVQAYLSGSPLRGIQCEPAFDHFWFVDRNGRRVSRLEALIASVGAQKRATIWQGDSNQIIRQIVSCLRSSERALVFLDPYGLQVEWKTVEFLASTRRVDVFINFSLMGVIRNLRRKGGPTLSFQDQLAGVMANTAWITDLYVEQGAFWDQPFRYRRDLTAKQVAEHYSNDLRTVFSQVSNSAIMKNSRGAPLYALVLGSHSPSAPRIMNDIIQKYSLLS